MPLMIFNTLTKRKEEFKPLVEGQVKMYNCGPTVYDYFHIGNARNFITAETICRYLEYKGYKVTFIQNVTDVEDKIINKAKELGIKPSDVAEKFTKVYFKDLSRLGTRTPDISPKATEHINDIIQFVQKLIEKGVAYEVDGDVYFEVAKFKDYGKLSGQKVEDTEAGASQRVAVDERKRHPADFTLWKKSEPGEIGWQSPWGLGRPGWHIECSVMSSKYLGETFDIHLGGNDLIFPHHENEIAQSEALTGKILARYWIHNGMLQLTGAKMSKSLGNIKTIREILLDDYDPNAIRFYLLSAHYRGPLELKHDSLDEAQSAIQRIRNCVDVLRRFGIQKEILTNSLSESEKEMNHAVDDAYRKFEESMDDDFNTSGAIGAIFELVAAANKFTTQPEKISEQGKAILGRVHSAIIKLCQALGINLTQENLSSSDKVLVEGLLKLLIQLRQNTRQKKDWAMADMIRDGLAELNIKLEDTKEGTIWKIE